MKALTVQQPWAWAIIHGGKVVENRTTMWASLVGQPLAIHAGARLSERGCRIVPGIIDAEDQRGVLEAYTTAELTYGALIGVVDVVDAHEAFPEMESAPGSGLFSAACCESWWAEQSYEEHGGKTRNRLVHYVLENPRELAAPFRCRGKLGLWTPPAEALELLEAA